MFSIDWWRHRLYAEQSPNWIFEVAMEEVVRHVKPHSQVLDIGAGEGKRNSYDLKGRCGRIVGIDFDDRVTSNPLLDEGRVHTSDEFPLETETIDVAFSIFVLEHVDQVDRFAEEVSRVLKPGGVFVSLTPNKWHYVSMIAKLTPTSFHVWINRGRGRDEEDTFPTRYRFNTAKSQKRILGRHGLRPELMRLLECEPKYLKFSLPTYLLGALYERVVNSTELLNGLRVNILSTFRKEA